MHLKHSPPSSDAEIPAPERLGDPQKTITGDRNKQPLILHPRKGLIRKQTAEKWKRRKPARMWAPACLTGVHTGDDTACELSSCPSSRPPSRVARPRPLLPEAAPSHKAGASRTMVTRPRKPSTLPTSSLSSSQLAGFQTKC